MDTKQHTVYLTAAQWEAIKKLDFEAPTIVQADLLQGSDHAGHIVVSDYRGEGVHLDRQGNVVRRIPA